MLSGEGRSLENIGVHLQKVTDGFTGEVMRKALIWRWCMLSINHSHIGFIQIHMHKTNCCRWKCMQKTLKVL